MTRTRRNNLTGVADEHLPLVKALLQTSGAYAVKVELDARGITYSQWAVDSVRRAMDKSGERTPVARPRDAQPLLGVINDADIVRSSAKLAERTRAAFAVIAERESIPFEHAGVLALYGREAFERWQAVAA